MEDRLFRYSQIVQNMWVTGANGHRVVIGCVTIGGKHVVIEQLSRATYRSMCRASGDG